MTKIESFENVEKQRIVVLKDKLSILEQKLYNVCSDILLVEENKENFETFM